MRRVLIANRGEIAVRIARACRAAGLECVAVASDADLGAPHTLAADRMVRIGPAPARESYLDPAALLEAARASGADAVHPGYGFLAENAAFARAVETAGLVWIGPPADAIATMGDKLAARAAAMAAGVPVVPGTETAAGDSARVAADAERVGYPLLVKAAAGGGGKGMRIVRHPGELSAALEAAAREAAGAFADDRVYLERLLERPRHVEIQVLADRHGAAVHLGERECSVQRRHQKIVEESPCPVMTPALREAMSTAALAAARAVGYVNAGTVEFLLDASGRFYFLEMNTRLQVEHPVTELVTGIDLVAEQLRIARGEPLGFSQADVRLAGHAIEVRLYAEDPQAGFLPSAGPLLAWQAPAGPGIRVDAGVAAGMTIPVDYDPMLAKIAAWGPDRATAIARLRAALGDTVALGPYTNLAFLADVLEHPAFRAGETHTGFVDEHLAGWRQPLPDLHEAALAAALAGTTTGVPAAASGSLEPVLPTPWERLGRWRLGT
ncbi:MAG TPA: biotin carboxylase N-terminal domain-containing protein [Candidatus Limnocylindria bacterium]|nr:biotin carboxylase N-terminal domain-containing protein [Candidatus Limnocylindria bacterium]